MTVEVLDRKVESQEEINVSAGSFKAFKISQTTKISSKLFNRSISSIEYFVPGFGVIKSVTLDKKGETSSYSELIAIKN
nr:hypothetical protein [Pararhodonellum marinum]